MSSNAFISDWVWINRCHHFISYLVSRNACIKSHDKFNNFYQNSIDVVQRITSISSDDRLNFISLGPSRVISDYCAHAITFALSLPLSRSLIRRTQHSTIGYNLYGNSICSVYNRLELKYTFLLLPLPLFLSTLCTRNSRTKCTWLARRSIIHVYRYLCALCSYEMRAFVNLF